MDMFAPPLGLQPAPAVAAALIGRHTLDCLGATSHVGAVRLLGSSPWADMLADKKAAECEVVVAGRRGAWLGRLDVEADPPRPARCLRAAELWGMSMTVTSFYCRATGKATIDYTMYTSFSSSSSWL